MYVSLLFFMLVIVPVPVMVWKARKGANAYRSVLAGIIGTVAAAIAVFIAASASGHPVGQELQAAMNATAELLARNSGFMTALGFGDLSYADRVDTLNEIYNYTVYTFPGMFFIWTAVLSYFGYMLTAKLVNKKERRISPLPAFRNFCLPRNALIGFIVIFLLSWLSSAIGIAQAGILYLNVNLIFEFVFSIQGAAVLFYFCESKRVPKAAAVVLTLVFFLTGFGKTLLFILGITDLVFGLRARMLQKSLRR